MTGGPGDVFARIMEFSATFTPYAGPSRIELGPVAMEKLLAHLKRAAPYRTPTPFSGLLDSLFAVPLVNTDKLGDRGWRVIGPAGEVMSEGVWEMTIEEAIEELGEKLGMPLTPWQVNLAARFIREGKR